jgi:hypothetical protein
MPCERPRRLGSPLVVPGKSFAFRGAPGLAVAVAGALASAIISCGSSSPAAGPASSSTATPVGGPTGDPVSATIGADGGAVTTADGSLRVVIPAGALPGPTRVSVQPKLLRADPRLELYVVGHTDNAGTFSYNMKLSRDRAASVAKTLAGEYGIAAPRLQASGVGPLAPVASNRAEEGRAKNRRVELVAR